MIGHSMGGLLALQMAARNKVEGVVTIAAALKPSNRKTHLAWLLKHFKTYVSGSPRERPPRSNNSICSITPPIFRLRPWPNSSVWQPTPKLSWARSQRRP